MLKNTKIQKDISWVRHVGTSPFTCFYACGAPAQPFGQTATVAPALNTLIAVPFMTGRGGVVNRITFEVTTGGTAGSVGRVGIYDNPTPTNFYPGSLVVDGGEYDTTTTGVKTSTISVELAQAKMYWAVYLCGVAAPTVRALTGTGTTNLLGYPSTIGATPYTELSVTLAYAALPATFTAGATPASASVPLIALRYSS